MGNGYGSRAGDRFAGRRGQNETAEGRPVNRIGLSSHETLKNGESRFEVTMTILNGPQTYILKQIDRYDAKARPIESITSDQNGGEITTRKYTFGPSKLTVAVTANGKTTVKTAEYPKGKSINRTSQRWFFQEMPLPGAVSREMVYQDNKWSERISRYMGLKEIELNGKKVKAYELLERRADGTDEVHQWVDKKGMPLRMMFTSSGAKLVLEREG
jgi:hypothetical protein